MSMPSYRFFVTETTTTWGVVEVEEANGKDAEYSAVESFDAYQCRRPTIKRHAYLISSRSEPPPCSERLRYAMLVVLGYLNAQEREYDRKKEAGEDVSEHIGESLAVLAEFARPRDE
jgi:hypothetical protein